MKGASLALAAAAAIAAPWPGAAQGKDGGQLVVRPSPSPPEQPCPASPDRITRAQANLIALRDGRVSVADLAPQDLQDVADLARIVQGAATDTRPPEQRCIDDELRRIGGRPSRLEWQVIALKCR